MLAAQMLRPRIPSHSAPELILGTTDVETALIGEADLNQEAHPLSKSGWISALSRSNDSAACRSPDSRRLA
jgi:hypothetical protein